MMNTTDQCELKTYQVNNNLDVFMLLGNIFIDKASDICSNCALMPYCKPEIMEVVGGEFLRVNTENYTP